MKLFFIILFTTLSLMADATMNLMLSGTVYDRGYTLTNGWLIPSQGFIITINGVTTTSKIKLTPNVDYKIIVESL